MAFSDRLQWVPVATAFPATLDTLTDPAKLKDGTSPDAYGLGLDKPGVLYKAACPTGTAQVKATKTIGANTWTWYYRRLWRSSAANLYYNAPEYTTSELAQDLGVLSFDEDAQAITGFIPFSNDSLFVAKSTGGYRVPNADSLGGKFQHGDIVECMKAAAQTNIGEINDVAYVSNASGLFSWDGQKISEVSAPARGAANFVSQALTTDEQKRRLVLGTSGVFEPWSGRLYGYSGTAFRFTTRTFTIGNGRLPFPVKGVAFVVDNYGAANGAIKFQVKRDVSWEKEITVQVRYTEGGRVFVSTKLDFTPAARQFAVRITDITGNIGIREIDIETFQPDTSEGSLSQ